MKFTPREISSNVHELTFRCGATDIVPALIISDVHYDSLKCDRKLLKKHLDEITERDGFIIVIGDWFDVMATYGDRRLKRENLDPRYIIRGRNYLDVVIDDSVEFLSDYADRIALIGYGNHETTIRKFHDTDPLRRLVARLNEKNGAKIQLGQYSGYVLVKMKYQRTAYKLVLHYHHGFGGNAKRSKGMLDVQIEVMKYPDANLLVRGHDHQKWYDPSTTRFRLKRTGEIAKDSIHYLKTGSYKDGLGKGEQGWETQKNMLPTRLGGWFVDFVFNKHKGISLDVTEAN